MEEKKPAQGGGEGKNRNKNRNKNKGGQPQQQKPVDGQQQQKPGASHQLPDDDTQESFRLRHQ